MPECRKALPASEDATVSHRVGRESDAVVDHVEEHGRADVAERHVHG